MQCLPVFPFILIFIPLYHSNVSERDLRNNKSIKSGLSKIVTLSRCRYEGVFGACAASNLCHSPVVGMKVYLEPVLLLTSVTLPL